MKEVTRIITVQITGIIKVDDNTELVSKEQAKEAMESIIKNGIDGVDDVVVTNVQDFERECEE